MLIAIMMLGYVIYAVRGLDLLAIKCRFPMTLMFPTTATCKQFSIVLTWDVYDQSGKFSPSCN